MTSTPIFENATSVASEIQRLEATYGPQAEAIGRGVASAYFSHLTILQVLSVMISAAFFAATIYVAIKTGWIRSRIDRIEDVILKTDLPQKHAQKSWDDVERHFFSGDENGLKIAIMKADTLLDEALREAGIVGRDLGERLRKVSPKDLPNIENVWEAHKLRNKIAHEINFQLKRDLAERALTVYEEALEQLGVLKPITGKEKSR